MTNAAKDLTKEAPRSPRTRIGGYAILGRTIDKCRALLWSNIGDYHFDCPLDNYLFSFKGVQGADFKAQVESGADDAALAAWLDHNGTPKSPDEIAQWGDEMEAANPYENPERREWFVEQCEPLGLDPAKTTLFDWLEADDRASYQGK
ncbi:MAG TPA: DUF5069 domain-containing protein [Chthoniobacteraceae bacterium]|jgi:hypothetical protein|nr:hypothetical protein [Chthoniobacter sp.]HEV7868253.1 DUF5069 domain-containing protein [Chthoniobacteraceae bacterium]